MTTPASEPGPRRDLTGRKAVVTGGTHGMGLAIVRALADRGAQVLATGRNQDNIKKAESEFESNGEVRFVGSDAGSLTEIAELAGTVDEHLGNVDHVFVNHGIAELLTIEEVTEESWDRHFTINTKGSFFTIQALAPRINDGGSIVLTTVANDAVYPGISAYSASKEAVTALAQVAAVELLPRRIRVNTVAPGFILTPTMGVKGLTDEQRRHFVEEGNQITPLRRAGTVDEIAQAALFLAVEATFTTGAEIPVDGGYAQGLVTS